MVVVPDDVQKAVYEGYGSPDVLKTELLLIIAETLEQIRQQMEVDHKNKVSHGWYAK